MNPKEQQAAFLGITTVVFLLAGILYFSITDKPLLVKRDVIAKTTYAPSKKVP